MNSHHQDRNFRKQLPDLPGSVNPIQLGHLKVEQDQVGRILPDTFERFPSVSSLPTYSPAVLQFEKAAQIMPYRHIVVDDKYSNHVCPYQIPSVAGTRSCSPPPPPVICFEISSA